MAQRPNSDRIIQLDALRGLAVLGIVWMNVYVFALPAQAYYNPVAWGGDTSLDRLVWAVSFVLIEDKFRTLFAMLFGAGCLILIERSESQKWRDHGARMAVLFLIGMAHSVLLASNDVLRAYAIAGLALPFVSNFKSRDLYAIAIGLVVLHCGFGLVVFGPGVVAFYAGQFNADAYLYAERRFGVDPASINYFLELGREGFGERIGRRIQQIPQQLQAVVLSVPLNLSAMALGMALWKDRMLAAEWRTFRLQRLAAICALIALPPLLGLAYWVSSTDFSGAVVGTAALLASSPFDMLLGLAYAALAMALFARRGAVTQRFAVVGRLSLSNYLMTSIILAAIFASWGLALFGAVTRAQTFALSFVPIAAMLAWSPAWVSRFGRGPFERFWRSLARVFMFR